LARKPSPTLTDGELRLMRVLWEQSEATVGDVVGGIRAGRGRAKPAYNTVLTLLRVMERKGYVRHRKDGRAFTFVPMLDERQVRARVLGHVLPAFFDGSPSLLLQNLLGNGAIDSGERQRIRQVIDRWLAPDAG
jgi:predicted transcriptional regulator